MSKIFVPCDKLIRIRPTKDISQSYYNNIHEEGKDLIRGWFRHSKHLYNTNPRNHFEAIIFCWIATNSWSACVADPDVDRKWVEAVAFDNDLNEHFQEQIHSDNDFKYRAESFKDLWPIFKASEIRRKNLLYKENQERSEALKYYFQNGIEEFEPHCWIDHCGKPPLDWSHTFITLYRVRCNLFHGEKSRYWEMDNLIVKRSFELLSSFIDKRNLF
jgi:hypothetical protein